MRIHQRFWDVEVRLEGIRNDAPYIYGRGVAPEYNYRYMTFQSLTNHPIDFRDRDRDQRPTINLTPGETNPFKVENVFVDVIYFTKDRFGGLFTIVVAGHQCIVYRGWDGFDLAVTTTTRKEVN